MATEAGTKIVEITHGATIALASANKVPTRAILVIHGVHAAVGGSPMYQVALKDAHGNVTPVGIINFFNMSAPHATEGKPWQFDATSALRALVGEAVAVVIEPVSDVSGVASAVAPDSKVIIEQVELVSR